MKRLLSMIILLVLTASVLAMSVCADEVKLISAKNENEITFSDVDKNTTAGKAIYKLANAGILVGDGDGTFRPGAPIKRAELCKIVNTIFGYTEKDATSFSDVTSNNWYYEHVLIAKKAGYIVGYDDGTFKGETYVTREQSCAILCRVANLVDVAPNVEIKDAVSEWAMPYVQRVLGNKLMNLEAGNTFRAQENIKRDEFSVVYANFVLDTPTETEKPSTGDSEPSGGGNAPSGGNRPSGGGNTSGGSEINYEKVNSNMLKNLKLVRDDIKNNKDIFSTEESAMMIHIIHECIKKVIADGSSNVIDKEYIVKKYYDIDDGDGDDNNDIDIKNAKRLFGIIKADTSLKTAFQNEIAYLDGDTIEWLLDAFDIDTSALIN